MRRPFPGMDPYLERHWRDVHLVARSDERVYVETDDAAVREIAPEVRVVERPVPTTTPAAPDGAVAVAQPVLLPLASEPVRERYIEIREVDGGKVVTAIEFISPTNKAAGDGRDAYLKQRAEFLDSDSNLVEVDLTRGGDWSKLMRPYRVPPEYKTTYRASVRRACRPEKGALFPITLRQRLPVIPIPLREAEQDVSLNLQDLIERVYADGRYDTIDYREPCVPPLEGEDAAWTDELLRAARRR